MRDLTPEIAAQIEHFFVSYNELAGRKFKPLRWVGASKARAALKLAPT